MSDNVAEIRARHEAGPRGQIPLMGYAVAHADRAALLDEVDRLRAEIERLREALREALSGLRYRRRKK